MRSAICTFCSVSFVGEIRVWARSEWQLMHYDGGVVWPTRPAVETDVNQTDRYPSNVYTRGRGHCRSEIYYRSSIILLTCTRIHETPVFLQWRHDRTQFGYQRLQWLPYLMSVFLMQMRLLGYLLYISGHEMITGIPRYTRSHFTRFRYNAI